MADTKSAIDTVLKQEDATLSGVITSIATDRGGRTRYGIAERWHPELAESGFFDTMPADEALTVAEKVYAESYAAPLLLAEIADQGVATALMSFAVVEGSAEAVTLLQRAAEALGAAVSVDGKMGPGTVAAANSLDGRKLLGAWGELEAAYFRHLAAVNPSQAGFVAGWLNRERADAGLDA